MFCPSCGAQNPNNVQFCEKCGAPLAVSTKSGSFPQQQAGFPQQQAGFPQQQAGFPQQQAGFPQQQAGFPQQQAGFPQQQAGFPQQQAGFSQPGPFSHQTYHQNTELMGVLKYLSQPIMRYIALGLIGFSCLTMWLPWFSINSDYYAIDLPGFTLDLLAENSANITSYINQVVSVSDSSFSSISLFSTCYNIIFTISIIALFIGVVLLLRNDKRGSYILAGIGLAIFILCIIWMIALNITTGHINDSINEYTYNISSFLNKDILRIEITPWVVLSTIAGLLGALLTLLPLPSVQQKLHRFG